MESLCAHCADRGFPCTTFWPAYPPRRLSEKTLVAMICAISKSAAISRRDAAKTLTGFASAGRQRGRDGLRTWDASPAKADRAARTRREMSVRMFQARPSGRREALGSVWGGAGRNRPPLHRGRRFRADRSPSPKDGDGPARRTDPRGDVRAHGEIAAKASSRKPAQRKGLEREARWTEQGDSFRRKAGLAKGRAGTDGGKHPLAGVPVVAAKRQRALPGEAGRKAAGTSDGSCGSGVRPAPEASGGVLPGTRVVLFQGDRAT